MFHDLQTSSWSFKALSNIFGPSSALVAFAQTVMRDTQYGHVRSSPSSVLDEVVDVSSCNYECDTAWGKEVGRLHCFIEPVTSKDANLSHRHVATQAIKHSSVHLMLQLVFNIPNAPYRVNANKSFMITQAS